MKLRALLFSLAINAGPAIHCTGAGAAEPLIPGYGRIALIEHPQMRPDPALDYKVVVNVTRAGENGAPPPELEKVAKLANLLAQYGVPAAHRHIVAVIQGSATMAVLSEAGMKARGKGANLTADLVAKLNAAGVRVDVCSQALAGFKIGQDEVMPGIQVDLSALTTLTTLELQGYAMLSD